MLRSYSLRLQAFFSDLLAYLLTYLLTCVQAFFNWISADAEIATARGGGGGLALWQRDAEMEAAMRAGS